MTNIIVEYNNIFSSQDLEDTWFEKKVLFTSLKIYQFLMRCLWIGCGTSTMLNKVCV